MFQTIRKISMGTTQRPETERVVATTLGDVTVLYNPHSGCPPCAGHGSFWNHSCKNRGRYKIEGKWLCHRHASQWALLTLIGKANMPSQCAAGGRVGDQSLRWPL